MSSESKTLEIESGEQSQIADEEEEGECGVCLYMKAGHCKESFIAFQKCLDDEEDLSKCVPLFLGLRKCMQEHSDYYERMLGLVDPSENEDGNPPLPEKGMVL